MSPIPGSICHGAGKRTYLSRIEAEGVAVMIVERDPDGPRYAYACPYCDGWHLSRKAPAVEAPTPPAVATTPPKPKPKPKPPKPPQRPKPRRTAAFVAQEAALVAKIRKAKERCRSVQGLPGQCAVSGELSALRKQLAALYASAAAELDTPIAAE